MIVATGLLLGRLSISGFSLGVAGVLFSGLFFGAWRDPELGSLHLSHSLRDVGLVLFVYAVGSVACFFLPEPAAEELPD